LIRVSSLMRANTMSYCSAVSLIKRFGDSKWVRLARA
jgi:hypothetical protein